MTLIEILTMKFFIRYKFLTINRVIDR